MANQNALFSGLTTSTMTPAKSIVAPRAVLLDQNLNAITPTPTQSIPLPLIAVGIGIVLVLAAGVIELRRG